MQRLYIFNTFVTFSYLCNNIEHSKGVIMDNVTKIFSKRLRQLRGTKSQDEAAKGIGISRGALSYYEKGERNPDINTLSSIAKYYGVSADYLLGLSDAQTLTTEEKVICDTIGLSPQSVEILKIHAQKAQENFIEISKDEDTWESAMWSYLFLQAINIIVGDNVLLGDIASYLFTTFTHYTDFDNDDDIYHRISSLELFDSKLRISYSDDYDFLSDAILLRIQRELSSIRSQFIQDLYKELQAIPAENEEYPPEVIHDTIRSILDTLIHRLTH